MHQCKSTQAVGFPVRYSRSSYLGGNIMSCLTRELQRQLTRYLLQHRELKKEVNPSSLRTILIGKGLCPSDVTTDQVSAILENIRH